jgi:hypothetical protein
MLKLEKGLEINLPNSPLTPRKLKSPIVPTMEL